MATDTFSLEVIRDLYQGLTDESPSGETIPGVADSWTVNAEGRTYVFHLRPEARWSDGKQVTAGDFVAAWRRALDPQQAAPNAEILRVIEGAAAIMDHHAPLETLGVLAPQPQELVVHLALPAPYFPAILSHPASFPVYSDAVARSHEAAQWISNGPYVLASWSPGSRVTLKRNAQFWDKTHISIEAVDYDLAPDEHQQLLAYRAGQLDLTDNVPTGDLPSVRHDMPRDLRIAPILVTMYLGLNLTRGPLALHRDLRQALSMAIDRPKITALLGGGQVGAFSFLPPGTWNYTPQVWDWSGLPDAERLAQAQALYAKAGFSKSVPLKVRLLYNSNPGIKQTVIAIAAMWKEALGVETELLDEEYRVFLDSRHDRARWDIARLAWSADYNDAGSFLETLRTTSVNNDQAYNSPDFDAQLLAAAHDADPQKRRQALESAERLMLGDYPIIPVYHYVSKRLVKPYVTGAMTNPLNHLASKDLALIAH